MEASEDADAAEYAVRAWAADAHSPGLRNDGSRSPGGWSPLSDYFAIRRGFCSPLRKMGSDVLAGDFFKQLLAMVWPQVAVVAAKLVSQQFADTLKELRTAGPDLATSVVRNMSFDFGSNPPEIRKLLSCRKVPVANGEGVEICCHLHWQAEANIQLSVGRVGVGIKGLSTDGLACILFTPLLDDMPIIGGCHFFFCNMPKLQLQLTGLANVLPKRMLKYALQQSLQRTVVLPNRLAVRAGASTISDFPSFKNPPPIGVLRVHVLSARRLVKAEWGWGKWHPFCVLGLGGQQRRTAAAEVERHDQDPRWSEAVDLLVYHHRQLLDVQVFTESKMKKDDALGCTLPTTTVAKLLRDQRQLGKQGEQWIALETGHLPRHRGRLLGAMRTPQDKKGHLSPRSPRAPGTKSAVCLRVQYSRLHQCADMGQTLSTAVKHNTLLLSVKLWHLLGDRSCIVKAKGAKISLAADNNGDVVQSTKCRQISPLERWGCTAKDVDSIRRLSEMGVPRKDISEALGFGTDVIKALADLDHACFGWNSTLHLLLPDAEQTVKLNICLDGKWFELGEPFHLSQLLSDKGRRACTDLAVSSWPQGDLKVRVSLEFRGASTVLTQNALEDFDAFDGEGEFKPGEEWLLGAAPEQEDSLRPGASDDTL